MNNNAIATIYSRWSVASSFNSWGMWRFENSNEEGGHVAAVIKNVDSGLIAKYIYDKYGKTPGVRFNEDICKLDNILEIYYRDKLFKN